MNRVSEEQYNRTNLLLPWFVTGKLTQAEKNEVESVLDVSQELKDELKQQKELANIIYKDPSVLGLVAISSQEKRLDDLLTRINQPLLESKAAVPFWQSMSAKVAQSFENLNDLLSSHRLQAAFSLFVVAQVAILAVVMNSGDTDNIDEVSSDSGYELQGDRENPQIAGDETVLAFQFTLQTDEETIDQLFNEIDARVVEHSENSLNYKVVLKGVRSDQEVNNLINNLEKRNQLILLVGRGYYK